MLVKQFDYHLPTELISQHPIKPRDHARLLILNRKNKSISHRQFFNIVDYFEKGDVLVLNDSKVIPARLLGKKETGGAMEIFLLNEIDSLPTSPFVRGRRTEQKNLPLTKGEVSQSDRGSAWSVLIKGKIKPQQKVFFKKGIVAEIIQKNEHFSPPYQGGVRGGLPNDSGNHPNPSLERRGNISENQTTWIVKFNCDNKKLFSIGSTPLPPYIKSKSKSDDYQTVFAKPQGSVAAPTAGLHFTKRLLNKLIQKGVKIEYITLHVGLGTFAPVKTDKIEDHKIHSEFAIIDKGVAGRINKAKQAGHRIIACGTTSVRTLEAFSQSLPPSLHRVRPLAEGGGQEGVFLSAGQRWVNIFIYPSYKFKLVDAIITNFHLPKSTLLMLISAFAEATADTSAFTRAMADKSAFGSKATTDMSGGRDTIMKAYQEAIKEGYKFYSFGDAMLII